MVGALLLSLSPGGQTGASRFAPRPGRRSQGKSLVDVGLDDFVVQESGSEREVLDVRVADYPVAIVRGRRRKERFRRDPGGGRPDARTPRSEAHRHRDRRASAPG